MCDVATSTSCLTATCSVAEKKTLAEVIAAGFDTNLLDASIFTQGYMLPDSLSR